MPIGDAEIQALGEQLGNRARELLLDRGWEGNLVLVPNPYAHEWALRIEATARLANQQIISGLALEASDNVAPIMTMYTQMMHGFPVLPGSAASQSDRQRLDEERQALDRERTRIIQRQDELLQDLARQGRQGLLSAATMGVIAGMRAPSVEMAQPDRATAAHALVREHGADLLRVVDRKLKKLPKPKSTPVQEPEPTSKWERLLGEDLI